MGNDSTGNACFFAPDTQYNGQFSKCRLKATISLACSGSCLERFLLAHPYIQSHTRISCHAWLQALMAGITGQSSIISLQLKGLVYIVMQLILTIPTLSTNSSGLRCFPSTLRSVPTYDPLPIIGINQELFKTTDGGATWQSVLKNIPYASQVQLATGNPQVIYVGGTMGPLPLVPGVPRQSYPFEIGSFHLQMSTNGGSTWQNVAIPSDMQSIQNWFVSSVGQVYASPTIPFSSQPTVIPGTIATINACAKFQATPQTGIHIPP